MEALTNMTDRESNGWTWRVLTERERLAEIRADIEDGRPYPWQTWRDRCAEVIRMLDDLTLIAQLLPLPDEPWREWLHDQLITAIRSGLSNRAYNLTLELCREVRQ